MRTDTKVSPSPDGNQNALLKRAAELGAELAFARSAEMQPAPDRLLNVDDIAALFGVHRITVRSFVKRGIIPPPVRVGNKLTRWRRRDILAHLDNLPPASPGQAEGDE